MRLPRRVPWTSLSELDQVCAWIYADEHDLHTKTLAINRLSAWKTITPLPQALESTLALLVVLQQDTNTENLTSHYLSLRQSYAAAIIRLVNGLVDPLQLGAYARSIASIAMQLGIPSWLVELRHAATHEDLPSLEVLREAARQNDQSMSWLFHNYFLPTINPASVPQRNVPLLRPLEPLLKQYKSVLKIITRDASLRTRYKQEINTIMRDVERWIAEAKVAANMITGEVGWDTGAAGLQETNSDGGVESKEKWALERFCDTLLEKGGLVPLSKKKRIFPEDKFWPPQPSISLWKPLLQHIQYLHVNFAYILCTQMISLLLSPNTVSGSQNATGGDPSFNMCIACWVMWSLDTWSTASSKTSEESDPKLRKDVVMALMQGLGRQMGDLQFKDRRVAISLLQAITLQNPEYSTATEFLSRFLSKISSEGWVDQDLTIMTGRLTEFQSFNTAKPSFSASRADITSQCGDSDVMEIESNAQLPMGWKTVDSAHWKPCPIGVFQRV